MATEPVIRANHAAQSRTMRPSYWRVFAIIYVIFLLMLAVVGVSLGYWTNQHIRRTLLDEITRTLAQKAHLVADRVNADRGRSLRVIASQEGQAAGARATIIDSNGQVVADSEAPVAAQENMGKLPEFTAALSGQKIGRAS